MGLAVNASIVDPVISGLGVYSVNVIKGLAQFYDDLLIYTSYPDVFASLKVRIRKISCQLGPAYGKRAHVQRLLWSQFVLPARLKEDNVDILFSTIPEGVVGGSIPQCLVVHDLTPLRFPKEYSLQWCYFQWYVKPLLRRVQSIIAVSEQTKADIMNSFGIPSSRIQVIPGGCNHEMYHVGINPDWVKRKYHINSYCLYIGNFHPHKNLLRLIQAFHCLGKSNRQQLVIAGKKDSRFFPSLQSQVEKLGLHDKVIFLDYVPQSDLPGLYAGADMFILPSLYEGFGLSLIEAMACGIPVVASKAGAIEEVVGKAGMLVDPMNTEEIAEAIHGVLVNAGQREALCHSGLEQAQKYSWSKTAKMVSHVISECRA